jgi:hypothetical protein
MYVEIFKTDVIVFIGDVKMCLTPYWQGLFSDPDFISDTHHRENVQLVDKPSLIKYTCSVDKISLSTWSKILM